MSDTATQTEVFPPSADFSRKAHISSMEQYKKMYRRSIEDPDGFWSEMAEGFHWKQRWTKVREYDFKGSISIKYFIGGKTNISFNCLDRHLDKRADQVAIIWEGNEPGEDGKLTYGQLHEQVCKFANALKGMGVVKGDRVCLYMQMVPELPVAMLACARIGAIHSIVFGGFSAEALRDRILDCNAETLITSNYGYRSGKVLPSKVNADAALKACPGVKRCIVVERIAKETEMKEGRDYWWYELMKDASATCEPEWMDAEDPLFILYTSGSTGKPKGVLHTTAGYLLFTIMTMKYVCDLRDE